ncbi:hypothetical protein ARMA_0966 [Ardenticatena maritima]|uniref:Uncharacterized protein n=1 Tax=Ardenticatena maritima TaxID=872965 RepID=A0A0M8K635_9CHLR|nr:hypothetical protein ARMA_0966 [Ardenticatena maritima]
MQAARHPIYFEEDCQLIRQNARAQQKTPPEGGATFANVPAFRR